MTGTTGRESDMIAILKEHVPTLRSEGLSSLAETARPFADFETLDITEGS